MTDHSILCTKLNLPNYKLMYTCVQQPKQYFSLDTIVLQNVLFCFFLLKKYILMSAYLNLNLSRDRQMYPFSIVFTATLDQPSLAVGLYFIMSIKNRNLIFIPRYYSCSCHYSYRLADKRQKYSKVLSGLSKRKLRILLNSSSSNSTFQFKS